MNIRMKSWLRRGGLTLVLVGLVWLVPSGVAQAQDEAAPRTAPAVVQHRQIAPALPPAALIAPSRAAEYSETEWTGPNTALIASGLVTFGIAYGASVVVAGTSDHPGDDHLYVPIAGPWIDLANRGDCPINSSRCDDETTNKVLLVIDGVVQGAGAIAVIGGLLSPVTHRTRYADKGVRVVPVSYGHGSPGLAAFGSF